MVTVIIKDWDTKIKDPIEFDTLVDEAISQLNPTIQSKIQNRDVKIDGNKLIIKSIKLANNKWSVEDEGIEVELSE